MEILCMGNFLLGLFADQLLTSWKSEMSYLSHQQASLYHFSFYLEEEVSFVCL